MMPRGVRLALLFEKFGNATPEVMLELKLAIRERLSRTGTKRAKSEQTELETCDRLLDACLVEPSLATASTIEPRRSTLFVPGDLARIEAPAQIINSACHCVKGAKFANWVH